MMKILFLAMNEYRLWAALRAAELLERGWPGQFALHSYRVQDINRDPVLENRLMEDENWADFVIVSAYGSIQALNCFSRLWPRLAGRKPVFFKTTMEEQYEEQYEKWDLETGFFVWCRLCFGFCGNGV